MSSSSQDLVLIGTTDNIEGECLFYEEELYNRAAKEKWEAASSLA